MNQSSALFESFFDILLSEKSSSEGEQGLSTPSASPVSLLNQGDNLWAESKFQALDRYIQAIKLSQIKGNWTEESEIYYRLVERLLEEKSYSEIIKLADFAFLRAKAVEDWNEAVQFVLWGVWMRFRENRRLEITSVLKEAVGFLDKVSDLEKALQVLETYIDACFIMGNFQETTDLSDQFLAMVRERNDPVKEYNHFTQRLIPCLIGLGKHETAKEAALMSLNIAQTQNNHEMMVKAFHLLSSIEIALGNHEKALINANHALELARLDQNDALVMECLAESAQTRNSMGLAYEGAQIAAEGLKISILKKNYSFIPRFLTLLKNNGEMKESVWDEFKQLADQSINAIRSSGNRVELSDCLSLLGYLFLEHETQTALIYYQELEGIYEQEENSLMIIEVNRSIARAYQNLRLYMSAAVPLEKALTLFYQQRLTNKWLQIVILLELSKVYFQMNNFAESERLLRQAKTINGINPLEEMSWALAYILSEYEGDLFLAQNEYYSAELAYWKSLSLLNTQFCMSAYGDIRLSFLEAVRKLSNNLLTACLRQSNIEPTTTSRQQRAFHYVEFSRSRFLLTQLGHTSILPPATIPISLLGDENIVLRNLQQFSTLFQNTDDTRVISEELETWKKLQAIWNELENIDSAAQQYVAIRRGDVLDFNAIKVCLED